MTFSIGDKVKIVNKNDFWHNKIATLLVLHQPRGAWIAIMNTFTIELYEHEMVKLTPLEELI